MCRKKSNAPSMEQDTDVNFPHWEVEVFRLSWEQDGVWKQIRFGRRHGLSIRNFGSIRLAIGLYGHKGFS